MARTASCIACRTRDPTGGEKHRPVWPLPAPPRAESLSHSKREAVSELRAALATCQADELPSLFQAFDLGGRYDHPGSKLDTGITLAPELALSSTGAGNDEPATGAGPRSLFIAGAGFEPATSGL